MCESQKGAIMLVLFLSLLKENDTAILSEDIKITAFNWSTQYGVIERALSQDSEECGSNPRSVMETQPVPGTG